MIFFKKVLTKQSKRDILLSYFWKVLSEDNKMKKAYNAPKAETLVIEAKDIITASRMLNLRSQNGGEYEVPEISWGDFSN